MIFKNKNGIAYINKNGIIGAIARNYNNQNVVEVLYIGGVVPIEVDSQEEMERIVTSIDELIAIDNNIKPAELETFKQGIDYALKLKG